MVCIWRPEPGHMCVLCDCVSDLVPHSTDLDQLRLISYTGRSVRTQEGRHHARQPSPSDRGVT